MNFSRVKPLYLHVVSIFIILLVSFIVYSKVLLGDGLIIYGDFSYPFYLERFIGLHYPLWNLYPSSSNISFSAKLSVRVFLFSFAKITNMSVESFYKMTLLLATILAGICMYIALWCIATKENTNKKEIIATAALISSIFYMYNPKSVYLIMWPNALINYALTPLAFVSFVKLIDTQKVKYVILLSLCMTLISGWPHYIMYNIILMFIWIVYVSALKRKIIIFDKRIAKSLLLVFFLYMCLNLYWISATFIPMQQISPNYVVSCEVLQLLSIDSFASNVFRLLNFWWQIPFPSGTSWKIVSFIVPILPLTALFFKRNRYVLYFSMIAIFFIFLGLGVGPNSIYPEFYHRITFSLPLLGWLFRAADKWGFILALSYSILIFFSIVYILERITSKTKKIVFVTVICMLLLVYAEPMAERYYCDLFVPTEIPEDYYNINNYLLNENPIKEPKALWIPRHIGKETTWAEGKVGDFVISGSSALPSFSDFSPYCLNYLNFFDFVLMANKTKTIGKHIDFLNMRYIVFHIDRLGKMDEDAKLLNALKDQEDIELVKQEGFISVFENPTYANHTNIPHQNIALLGGLDKFTSLNALDPFSPQNASLFFLGQTDLKNKNHTLTSDILIIDVNSLDLFLLFSEDKYLIKPFDATNHHDPPKMWSKAATNDPLHGPWHFYLEQKNIENWDFDYGKGLVLTWSPITIPERVEPKDSDKVFSWNFTTEECFNEWKKVIPEEQFNAIQKLKREKNALKAELYNSTRGWKTINSPLIPTEYGKTYSFELKAKGENAHAVHIKIAEYNAKNNIVSGKHVYNVGTENFNWQEVKFTYTPENEQTKYIQLQVWHGHETDKPLPNVVWIDDVNVYDITNYTEPVTLEIPFKVDKTDTYKLFIRYFKNQEGGEIKVHLDGRPIELTTKDQVNKFVWQELAICHLSKGKHTLILENVKGFNAVNLFALVPEEDYETAKQELPGILENKTIIYLLEAESDMYRKNAEVLNVGGEASNGEVLKILEQGMTWQEFEVLKEGYYKIALRLKGNFVLAMDNATVAVNSGDFGFVYTEPIYLRDGKHVMSLIPDPAQGSAQYLDVVWIYSVNSLASKETIEDLFTVDEEPAEVFNYTKVNPTRWNVQVHATRPFMLSFAEAYDPLWEARVYKDGEKMDVKKSIPLYSVINGFWIDETGDLEIEIRYKPQDWFEVGLWISGMTFVGCVGYLFYDWRRGRRDERAKRLRKKS